MQNFLGKNPSILKKFLLINFIIFSVIGLLTIFYLLAIEPSLVKKKSLKHIQIINNTINHIERLNIEFEKSEITSFLLSTGFLFQNLDRVQFFDQNLNLLGDTIILDLDFRSFSKNFGITEVEIGTNKILEDIQEPSKDVQKNKKIFKIENEISKYKDSKNFGNSFKTTGNCMIFLMKKHRLFLGFFEARIFLFPPALPVFQSVSR